MPNLRGDAVRFVHFAVASLCQKSRVGIGITPDYACRQHPWLDQYSRVFNRDVVQDHVALTREFLHDMHLLGVEETAAPKPGRIDERDGIEHQCVAFPTADGVSQIRRLDRFLGIMLAVIGRDDAILAVSAACIASLIEKDHVIIRLYDPPRWALARYTKRLTGHDRVVLVRPHVEFLNLVPVLWLIHWTIHVAEPRRRVELKIVGLIVLPVAGWLLRRGASAPAARHVVPDPVGIRPVACQ